ncbi:hypothetical protein JCM30471_08180 [Desulfuromonas carbonis]
MDEKQLRLATWNIHMGIGQDGQRNLPRTAEVLRQLRADLIGLQEVDNHIHPAGNDLQILHALTGLEVIAGPTMQRTTGDYGNALLTRLPVLKVERYDISITGGREPRGLLIVHVDWHGERLQVAVTHLGLRASERRGQVLQLIDCLSAVDRVPLILMGDFNEWFIWGRPRRWLQRHFQQIHSPATFPSRWPLFSLDHIFADPPVRLLEKQVVKTPLARQASDHLPLTAIFIRPTRFAKGSRAYRELNIRDRVGGGVAPAVLPHHRAYGSVHGGSQGALKAAVLIGQADQPQVAKEGCRIRFIHVRGP